ncbi:hypothetical protein [uncultured Psychroserpens sp.]|uniref:hypothetical protein n=1 Tax=uncultured Psychroserpens sp. TaxID=255436 RepID=UPI00262DDA2A|nr:hypothetical protein [uncultured Psychroserpens sp.]
MADNSVLEKLVEYILLELLEAQNASNEASAKLAENYSSDDPKVPNLEYFPIPNSSIRAFDFALKFALKDIGVILTDDAISKINDLIIETWELYLNNLVNYNVIIEDRKKALLKQIPIVDLRRFKSDITEKDDAEEESIASLIEKEILLAFLAQLPKRRWGKKEALAKSSFALNLKEKINQILFSSKREQEIPLSDFKAVFDINQLNDITEDIVCSINVHVEMRNFESAYHDHDKDSNLKTRILTLK